MIALLQRVSQANVQVAQQIIGQIDAGLLVLIAVEQQDSKLLADRLLQRLLNYRVFTDKQDKMNLSLRDINGGLLLVPQFTLAADTKKGNRPSFAKAANPILGAELFAYLCSQASKQHPIVAFGQFGAQMAVSLINDGPVTFWLKQ
jgi:D-aminoacyl-tRNA deacylase